MSWHRFFRRRRADAELMAEMESYMAGEIAENVARGIPEGEARRRARIKFGNPGAVRETLWQQNTVTIIDNLWRDLRYATRTLTRTPGFATIAILVMALGIGANVALFTVVRSVLLNPLPFPAPNQLVALYAKADTGKGGSGGSSHIQPKTSVKDLDLALIQWETRLDALIPPRLAGLLLDCRPTSQNLETIG